MKPTMDVRAEGLPFCCPECMDTMQPVYTSATKAKGCLSWYCRRAIGQQLPGGVMPKGDPHKSVYPWGTDELVRIGARRITAEEMAEIEVDQAIATADYERRARSRRQHKIPRIRGYWK